MNNKFYRTSLDGFFFNLKENRTKIPPSDFNIGKKIMFMHATMSGSIIKIFSHSDSLLDIVSLLRSDNFRGWKILSETLVDMIDIENLKLIKRVKCFR